MESLQTSGETSKPEKHPTKRDATEDGCPEKARRQSRHRITPTCHCPGNGACVTGAERTSRLAEIRRSLELLHEPGSVFEVRGLDVPIGRNYRGIVSGYYDDLDRAATDVLSLEERGAAGIYVTINPCVHAVLARSANHLTERPKHATGDAEIGRRLWLLIDIDPDRPAGIAATDAERQAATELAAEIEDILRCRGWAYALLVDSGNGAYLLYRIDLPNTDETTNLVKQFYAGLRTLITERCAHIDDGVFNAARITRIGGTTNRKGDNIPDRPHRRCHYREPIADCPVTPVPVELIRAIADLAPQTTSKPTAATHANSFDQQNRSRLDVERWLSDRKVEFHTKAVRGGIAYLVPCPFNPNHGANGETAVVQADTGLLTFECKHNSCQGRRWVDFRDAIGKPKDDHYDPPRQRTAQREHKQTVNSQAATSLVHPTVEPGTIVKAADRQNFGVVARDLGDRCVVHFVSPEGHAADVELHKSGLTLQHGTPLASGATKPHWTRAPSIGELVRQFLKLRRPIIHKLLRIGETVNIIAPPKRGKSWLAIMLAIAVVLGRKFLDSYDTEPGKVLILDNELHGETSADRVPKVVGAMGVQFSDIQDHLFVENFRGKLADIFTLEGYFEQYEPGELSMVIVDALYRFLPKGCDENSNPDMTQVYNQIDAYAMKLGCGFSCIHHASKGSQSGKSVTDVGAGAGSQARAVDTHLILRDHAQPDCVVLEAAARSWPPVEPIVLRWQWPIWTLATDLDPKDLKSDRPTAQDKLETIKADILRALVHFPDGGTKTAIQQHTGRPSMWERAMRELLDEGKVELCEVPSKSHNKPDPGYKRVYRDNV